MATHSTTEAVEAFQLTEESRWDNTLWPDWLMAAWKRPNWEVGSVYPTPGEGRSTLMVLMANDGSKTVEFGDWLVKYPSGMLTRLTADQFSADECCERMAVSTEE